jgi:hypothetical protein
VTAGVVRQSLAAAKKAPVSADLGSYREPIQLAWDSSSVEASFFR